MSSLGIDFGTSTTIAVISEGGRTHVVQSKDGDEVIPSFVAFPPNGQVEVGRNARARRSMDPANTLYSIKRIMGRPWFSREVRQYQKQYRYELEQGRDQKPRFITRVGRLTAVEAAAYVLTYLRESPALNQKRFDTVTLSVPVSFDEEQRQAIVETAARAGLSEVTLIEEPCAAALACHDPGVQDQTIFVYDLGGGTFDTAIVRWGDRGYEVLSSNGDAMLGGDFVDLECAKWVSRQVLEKHRWDIESNTESFQRLLFKCEHAKILLSVSDTQELDLSSIDEVLRDKSITLNRAQVEDLASDLVRRSFVVCDDTLRNAKLTIQDIGAVVMSGGGAYMPMVRRRVEEYFGRAPKSLLSPDRLVATGAALQFVPQ